MKLFRILHLFFEVRNCLINLFIRHGHAHKLLGADRFRTVYRILQAVRLNQLIRLFDNPNAKFAIHALHKNRIDGQEVHCIFVGCPRQLGNNLFCIRLQFATLNGIKYQLHFCIKEASLRCLLGLFLLVLPPDCQTRRWNFLPRRVQQFHHANRNA